MDGPASARAGRAGGLHPAPRARLARTLGGGAHAGRRVARVHAHARLGHRRALEAAATYAHRVPGAARRPPRRGAGRACRSGAHRPRRAVSLSVGGRIALDAQPSPGTCTARRGGSRTRSACVPRRARERAKRARRRAARPAGRDGGDGACEPRAHALPGSSARSRRAHAAQASSARRARAGCRAVARRRPNAALNLASVLEGESPRASGASGSEVARALGRSSHTPLGMECAAQAERAIARTGRDRQPHENLKTALRACRRLARTVPRASHLTFSPRARPACSPLAELRKRLDQTRSQPRGPAEVPLTSTRCAASWRRSSHAWPRPALGPVRTTLRRLSPD